MNEPHSLLPNDDRAAGEKLGGESSQLLQHIAALVVAGVPMSLGIAGSPATIAEQIRKVARQLDESVPLDLVTGLTPELRRAIETHQASSAGDSSVTIGSVTIGSVTIGSQPSERQPTSSASTRQILDSLAKYPEGDRGGPTVSALAFQTLGIVALAALLFVWHCCWVIPAIANLHRQISTGSLPWPVAAMEHIGHYAIVYSLIGLVGFTLVGLAITRSRRGSVSPLQATNGFDRSLASHDARFRPILLWHRRQDAIRGGMRQMTWSLISVAGISGLVTMLYGLALFGPMTQLLHRLAQDWGMGK